MGIEQRGRAADGHQRIERSISVEVVPDEEQKERLVGDDWLSCSQGGPIPALPTLGSDDLPLSGAAARAASASFASS
jgi:hypothetical protein